MSEQAPPPEVETPPAAVEETPGTQQAETQAEIDYRKRYEDMRPEFDRKSQRLSELEQRTQWLELLATTEDPDTRLQAAQALGYEIDDGNEAQQDSPYLTREEWQTYQAQQQQLQEQQQQAQRVESLYAQATQDMAAQNVPEHLRGWVLDRAVTQQYTTPEGTVDVGKAHQEFVDSVRAQEQEAWRKTKQTHRISPVGQAGTQQPDLSTREGKTAYIMNNIDAEEL